MKRGENNKKEKDKTYIDRKANDTYTRIKQEKVIEMKDKFRGKERNNRTEIEKRGIKCIIEKAGEKG